MSLDFALRVPKTLTRVVCGFAGVQLTRLPSPSCRSSLGNYLRMLGARLARISAWKLPVRELGPSPALHPAIRVGDHAEAHAAGGDRDHRRVR
jgi:hypothetical protein